MKFTAILVVATASSLAACVPYVGATGETVPESAIEPYAAWPAELEGRTVDIVREDGIGNRVNFQPGGEMEILVTERGPVVEGVWGFEGDDTLCVAFAPRGEECWPYEPMVVGETQTVTSNRGQTLQVTMIDKDLT